MPLLLERSLLQADLEDSPIIKIDRLKLQELWSRGILNDLSYVSFALELHDISSLDMQQFSRDWSVEDLSENQTIDGWKAKTLKIRSIMNAIWALDDKGYLNVDHSVKVNQLSLFD